MVYFAAQLGHRLGGALLVGASRRSPAGALRSSLESQYSNPNRKLRSQGLQTTNGSSGLSFRSSTLYLQ